MFHSLNKVLFIVLFLSVSLFGQAVVDYRFDECSWDGTTGEVKDSSGNDLNGTAKNGANTTANGKINRAGAFKGQGYNADPDNTWYPAQYYVEVPNDASLSPLDGEAMSITGWFQLNKDGDNTILHKGGSTQEYRIKIINNKFNFTVWDGNGASKNIEVDQALETGKYYFFNVTAKIESIKLLFVTISKKLTLSANVRNGLDSYNGEDDFTTPCSIFYCPSPYKGNTNENLYIGAEPSTNYLDGDIDEIKIFDKVLTSTQIETIHNYENDGKNYDGSKRNPAYCPLVPTLIECFRDDFNRNSLGDSWSIIKEDKFAPKIEDSKLMITDTTQYVASGISRLGKFPSSSNYIEIEFEQNAYPNTSGADGMAVVFSDANIEPVAGGEGSSLGYANRYATTPGFAGGWIGVGLDEFGNFSSTDGGKTGGIDKTQNSVAIRGNAASTYTYIAGTDTLTPPISSAAAQNYKYKILIDTRENETTISVQRDINDGNGFVNLLYGQNATQSATAPDSFRLSFTGSTGGATNTHSIDNLVVNAIDCGTLEETEDPSLQYKFDAWDTFRSITDRNISTKITGEDFNLTIASLNEANDAYQDFNGTVCSCLDNDSVCFKNQFTDNNISIQTVQGNPNFTIDKAMKDTRVKIYWKENVNSTCNALLVDAEANSTLSTDNFAIRPKEFEISPSSLNPKAGSAFDFDVLANAMDYNETVDLNITLHDTSKTCEHNESDFNLTSVTFIDGNSSNSVKFDDVGVVDINMTDKDFASVDNDDTPKNCEGTFICSNDITITITPYKFIISDYNFTKTPAEGDWLYMADVKDMNITYNYAITAQNESNGTTENFDAKCYAGDVDTFMNFTSTSSDGNVSYYEMVNNTVQTAHDKELDDFNLSATINDQNFTNGVSSEIVYALNVYREYNYPKNPMSINITEINTTNNYGSENVGLLDSNGSKFYFGRVSVKDIETTENLVEHSVDIEVYDNSSSSYVEDFKQNSLKWYINKEHTGTEFGEVKEINASATTIKNSLDKPSVSIVTPYNAGKVTLEIDADNSGRYIMHLNISSWFWYALDDVGDPYDDSNGSNCLAHPCFTYIFKDNSGNKISSGDFQGGDANVSKRGDYTKKGVKVYR